MINMDWLTAFKEIIIGAWPMAGISEWWWWTYVTYPRVILRFAVTLCGARHQTIEFQEFQHTKILDDQTIPETKSGKDSLTYLPTINALNSHDSPDTDAGAGRMTIL